MADTVLVTGAGGFIGSHLVEALVARGQRVRALVRYNGRGDLGNLELVPRETRAAIEVLRGDITDPFFVRNAVEGCAVVYHLAALIAIPYSYLAPRNVFDVNVMGTLHVAQACVATGAALVHTSTSEVYGSAQTVPIAETHPLVGQSPYAASKIGADQCVGSYHRTYGLRTVTVRPFNTYGPRQSARAIIPTIITQALAGQTVRLGSLHTTRDLNYVGDTVAGFLAAGSAVDRVAGETLNLGTGTEVSVGALAEKIFELLGVAPRIELDTARVRPRASEVERLVADASRARSLLGWQPTSTLDEGLTHTIAFVRDHLHRYRPDEYAV
jgi:dTDP-glucose 4,6-dehydratase